MRASLLALVVVSFACRTIPPPPAGPAKVGASAPLVEGETLNPALAERTHYASIEDDRVLVIDFGASYCHPCWLELPHLQALQKKYGDRVTFVLVLIDDTAEGLAMAKEAVDASKVRFPVLADPGQKMADAYGVAELPTLWVADRNGNLVWSERGFKGGTVETLDTLLAKLTR